MHPYIIGINGKIGHGKDTVCKIIQNLMPPTPWETSWENKKFARKLKEVAGLLLGFPPEVFEDQQFKATYLSDCWSYLPPIGEDMLTDGIGLAFKKMTVREFLQKLGTNAVREGLHRDTWVNALFSDLQPTSRWIITDMRFPNEFDAVAAKGGKTIRVTRRLAAPAYPTLEDLHPSETALDSFQFDYEIENDGTLEDLTKEVRKCLEMLDILPLRL